MRHLTTKLGIGLVALTFAATAASAETLRWARSGDSLTLDPHAQNEGPTHTLAHQIYEPLLHQLEICCNFHQLSQLLLF